MRNIILTFRLSSWSYFLFIKIRWKSAFFISFRNFVTLFCLFSLFVLPEYGSKNAWILSNKKKISEKFVKSLDSNIFHQFNDFFFHGKFQFKWTFWKIREIQDSLFWRVFFQFYFQNKNSEKKSWNFVYIQATKY